MSVDEFFLSISITEFGRDDDADFSFGGLLGPVTFESAGNFTASMAVVKMNEPDNLQNCKVIDSGGGVESSCGVFYFNLQ